MADTLKAEYSLNPPLEHKFGSGSSAGSPIARTCRMSSCEEENSDTVRIESDQAGFSTEIDTKPTL